MTAGTPTNNRRVITFQCAGAALLGMLELPARPRATGVLVVVGGPQYRVGSHRQFVLLARALAARGYPVMRFDYRGMGDSEGEFAGFESIGPDIAAAVKVFRSEVPGLRKVVLWGLCDGATAAAFHAAGDPAIGGLILANPWVRTGQGLARSYVRHYYLRRLFEPDAWHRLLRGDRGIVAALGELLTACWRAIAPARTPPGTELDADPAARRPVALPVRVRDALAAYRGPVLILLSGDDLTAQEFSACSASRDWRPILQRPTVTRLDLPGLDHTFSRQEWLERVNLACTDWLDALPPPGPPALP